MSTTGSTGQPAERPPVTASAQPPIEALPRAGAKKDLRKLIFLLRMLSPYKSRIAVAMLALAVAASTVLLIGQGLKHVIDQGFSAANASTLDSTLIALLGMLVVLGVSTFTRYYLMTWVGERFVADIRNRVFAHVLTLSPSFFDRTRTGEVISRLTNDTSLVQSVVGGVFSYALRNVVLFIGGLVMLFITSVKLTLLVLVVIPVVLVPMLALGRRIRTLSKAMTDRVADASAYVDETIHEVRTVQAYGHESVDEVRFGERVAAVFELGITKARYNAALIAAVIVLVFGAIGVILWVGGRDVIEGRLTPGALSAFVFYAIIVANAVAAVSEMFGELMRAAGASERLVEILETPAEIAAPLVAAKAMPQASGRVELKGVRFAYPSRPETLALNDVSIAVAPDEVVALVGPSGAGKTTVFQLIQRFYDPAQGSVNIDSVNLRDVDPRDARARVAVVSQDPVIFAASVLDNVRYGKPSASVADVRVACEAAFALDFIEAMPDGFATNLGERGVRLSGGQRQRIAIARAFLANREILLLDEATSALDAESERMVQEAMQSLVRNRTTLIIAHRLATVKSVDRIVVLDQGRIVAEGSHDSLVAEGGLYARLASLQLTSA